MKVIGMSAAWVGAAVGDSVAASVGTTLAGPVATGISVGTAVGAPEQALNKSRANRKMETTVLRITLKLLDELRLNNRTGRLIHTLIFSSE